MTNALWPAAKGLIRLPCQLMCTLISPRFALNYITGLHMSRARTKYQWVLRHYEFDLIWRTCIRISYSHPLLSHIPSFSVRRGPTPCAVFLQQLAHGAGKNNQLIETRCVGISAHAIKKEIRRYYCNSYGSAALCCCAIFFFPSRLGTESSCNLILMH